MYTAIAPSPRYRQLLHYYRLMHREGFSKRIDERVVRIRPEDAFRGLDLNKYVYSIRGLIKATEASSLLDYGSGKGRQYSEELVRNGKVLANSLHDFWNVREITCYDPAINRQFLSDNICFDGVIATNVIDHIPEEDVGWVIERLFERANKFVFLNVADFAAPYNLPNGENARVVRKPRHWWVNLITKINERFPDKVHCLAFAEARKTLTGKIQNTTSYIHNCPGLILPGTKVKIKRDIKVPR